MNGRRALGVVAVAAIAAVLTGCTSAGTGSPAPARTSPTPSSAPSPPATPPPTAEPTPATPGPTPTPAATPSAAARTLGPDTIAVVVTKDLVMRSEPGIKASSEMYRPWLQPRVQLYVLDGPVRASGYEWYEVMPLSPRYESSGWVAAASHAGEPWIKPLATPTCPPKPTTVAGLEDLAYGVRLACFGGVPITLRARLDTCGFVTMDAGFDPPMFSGTFDPRADNLAPILLGDPQFEPCSDSEDAPWADLYLDPAGMSPDPLPIGKVVEVTGIFDHPAARDCVYSSWIVEDSEPAAAWCRPRFVVTRVE